MAVYFSYEKHPCIIGVWALKSGFSIKNQLINSCVELGLDKFWATLVLLVSRMLDI